MTDKSSAEVARELDAERDRLVGTVEELKNRVSLGGMIDTVMASFGSAGGTRAGNSMARAGSSIARSVEQNPIPLALVGIGLAWMMSGARGTVPIPHRGGMSAPHRGDDLGLSHDAPYGYDRYGAPGAGYGAGVGYGKRYKAADYADYADIYDDPYYDDLVYGADYPDRDPLTGAPLGGHTDAASAGNNDRDGSNVRSMTEGARNRASGIASAAGGRLTEAQKQARSAAEHARQRAIDARRALEDAGRRGYGRSRELGMRARESAEGFLHEYPLAAGAIALAVGAALGGAIRNTGTENRLMGGEADQMRNRAADMAVEEARKARRVAEAAAEEARKVAQENRQDLEGRLPSRDEIIREAESRAEDAAGRIRQAGETEAERQRLGDTRND